MEIAARIFHHFNLGFGTINVQQKPQIGETGTVMYSDSGFRSNIMKKSKEVK